MEPFLTLEELKEEGLYPENFREELAPWRYHKFLEDISRIPRVFVVYGLRRSGKTYALIKLGEKLERIGYKMLYYEVKFKDEYLYERPGRIGKKLADLAKKEKLFIILDEAFNLPIPKLSSFLGALSRSDNAIVALAGSYTYDLPILRAEAILRHYPKLASKRVFYTTTPRIGTMTIRISGDPRIADLRYKAAIPNVDLLRTLELITDNLRISSRTLSLYNEILTTGGLPRVLLGVASLEEEIKTISDLLASAYSATDYSEKIHRRIPGRPSFDEIKETLRKLLKRGSGRYATIGLSNVTVRLALSSTLILPRRYIAADNRKGLNEFLSLFPNRIRLYPRLAARPIPSSYTSSLILEYLGIRMPYEGIDLEAIVAHSLLENYFINYSGETLIREVPIFTLKDIDFLYSPKYSDGLAIEVKSSLADEEELINTLVNASKLGLKKLFILLPAASLDNRTPLYELTTRNSLLSPSILLEELSIGDRAIECKIEEGLICNYSLYISGSPLEVIIKISNMAPSVAEKVKRIIERSSDRLDSEIPLTIPIIMPIELFVAIITGKITGIILTRY